MVAMRIPLKHHPDGLQQWCWVRSSTLTWCFWVTSRTLWGWDGPLACLQTLHWNAEATTDTGADTGTGRCVIDFKQRVLEASIYNLLHNFAALVVREIERADHQQRWQKALQSSIQRPEELTELDYMTDVIMMLDVEDPEWKVMYANNCLEDVTGLSRSQVTNASVWDSFVLAGKSRVR